MAKVAVHTAVTIVASQAVNVHYPAGFIGTAPHEHIERIVEAKAGERIGAAEVAEKAEELPAPPPTGPRDPSVQPMTATGDPSSMSGINITSSGAVDAAVARRKSR